MADAKKISGMLADRIFELIDALGLQGRRDHQDFVAYNPTRVDKNLGSFRICVSGSRRGVWAEFADADVKGDALDLVAYCSFHGDKKEAVKWAASWLGLGGGSGSPKTHPRTTKPHTHRQSEPSSEEKETFEMKENQRKKAVAIFLDAEKSIIGTPADFYLQGRGVDIRGLGSQPGALRFSPSLYNFESKSNWPAMIAIVTNHEGNPIGIHRTYLKVTAEGKAEKAPLKNAKLTLGSYRGGAINLWKGKSGKPLKDAPKGDVVFITEGIEDGLTVALACPDVRVLVAISVGNLANLILPENIETVVICADNDEPGSPAARALEKAIRKFQDEARKVKLIKGWGGHKDANALLQNGVKDDDETA